MNRNLEHDNNEIIAELQPAKQKRPVHYSALNLSFFKQIMRAQLSGNIIFPHGLGLVQNNYQQLRKAINDPELLRMEIEWYKDDWALIRERASLCGELFAMKEEEREELIALLHSYRNKQDPSSEEMAIVVATACLAKFHLWASLGLQERAQLGELIKHNFPELYARNIENMRWKRFFYRQLCEQDGDYICKAPSCDECKSYAECFA
jgi:nitrogen fixation protein NifQ